MSAYLGVYGANALKRELVETNLRSEGASDVHTSAQVSIRQHTSAYVSIRQHTSAYLRSEGASDVHEPSPNSAHPNGIFVCVHNIRQHASAHVSIRQRCA